MDFYRPAFVLYFSRAFDCLVGFVRLAPSWFGSAIIVILVISRCSTTFDAFWISRRFLGAGLFYNAHRRDLVKRVYLVFVLWISRHTADGLMTNAAFLTNLFKFSLFDPKEAANEILERDFSYDIIWSIFIASICITTAMQFTAETFIKGDGPSLIDFSRPSIFAVTIAGTTLFVCGTLNWTGQRFGGRSDFKSIFALVTWLQVVQLALQAMIYVCLALAPILTAFAQITILFWSMWIFVSFLDKAHGFENMFKTALVALLGVSLAGVLLLFIISLASIGT